MHAQQRGMSGNGSQSDWPGMGSASFRESLENSAVQPIYRCQPAILRGLRFLIFGGLGSGFTFKKIAKLLLQFGFVLLNKQQK